MSKIIDLNSRMSRFLATAADIQFSLTPEDRAKLVENEARASDGKWTAGGGQVASKSSDSIQKPVRPHPTQTPQFKKWFGNSKIVDENGNPLVVYHGTSRDFDTFDIGKVGSATGNYGHNGHGHYLSFDSQEAETYGDRIVPAYVSMKRPFVPSPKTFDELKSNGIDWIDEKDNLSIDYESAHAAIKELDPVAADLLEMLRPMTGNESDEEYSAAWDKFGEKHPGYVNHSGPVDLITVQRIAGYLQAHGGDDYYEPIPGWLENDIENLGISDKVKYNQGWSHAPKLHWITELGSRAEQVTDVIKKLGYDGVIAGSEIVAFDSRQIKSATGNKGSFDESNPRIDMSHFTEQEHPRGQPQNAGQFAEKPGGSVKSRDTVEETPIGKKLKFQFGKHLDENEAKEIVGMIRDGDVTSKNGGRRTVRDDVGPMVMSKIPTNYFDQFPDEDDGNRTNFYRSSTSPERVKRYAELDGNELPPITVVVNRKGVSILSDGGHRLMAAIDRGDKWVNAIIPSRLHEELHGSAESTVQNAIRPHVTSTPQFKQWFGDSKIVDDSGNPLVMYHGTREDFETMNTDDRGFTDEVANQLGDNIGSFFTTMKGTANTFAQRGKKDGHRLDVHAINRNEYPEGAAVLPVYLSISNPKVFKDQDDFRAYLKQTNWDARAHLEAAGHDGVVIKKSKFSGKGSKDKWVIAFRSHQIKSATGNKTFNPQDPRINMSQLSRFSITADDLTDMGQLLFKWNEDDHPRADDGKFTDKSGSAGGASGGKSATTPKSQSVKSPSSRNSHLPKIPQVGDVFTMPRSHSTDTMQSLLTDHGTHFGVNRPGEPDGWAYKIAKDQFRETLNDLNGVVESETDSGNSSIDTVLANKAKFLDRGNDGLVFDTGDGNVVKVASDVSFHWTNGINPAGTGSRRLAESVRLNEKMRSLGIGSLIPQKLVIHEGRAYSVMPKLDVETKMTQEQFDEVAKSIYQMHTNDVTVGDDIQVGLADGKAYIYDTGAAREGIGKFQKEDDRDRLKRLAEQHGLKFESFDPTSDYLNARDDAFVGMDSGKTMDGRRFTLLTAMSNLRSLNRLRPHISDDDAEFYSHDEITESLKKFIEDERARQAAAREAKEKGEASGQSGGTVGMSQMQFNWDEDEHPRGQPENAGQFAEKPGGKSGSHQPDPVATAKVEAAIDPTTPHRTEILSDNQKLDFVKSATGKVDIYDEYTGKIYTSVDSSEAHEMLSEELKVTKSLEGLGVRAASDKPIQVRDRASEQKTKRLERIKEWAGRKFSDPDRASRFTAWFNDSKVVNSNGEPMVIYHGTNPGSGSKMNASGLWNDMPLKGWFDQDFSRASFYAQSLEAALNSKEGDENQLLDGTVFPVYLSLQNPKVYPNEYYFPGTKEEVEELKRQGFDGVSGGGRVFAAFDHHQIKSATGNRGTFDSANPRIDMSQLSRFSITANDLQFSLTAEEKSKLVEFQAREKNGRWTVGGSSREGKTLDDLSNHAMELAAKSLGVDELDICDMAIKAGVNPSDRKELIDYFQGIIDVNKDLRKAWEPENMYDMSRFEETIWEDEPKEKTESRRKWWISVNKVRAKFVDSLSHSDISNKKKTEYLEVAQGLFNYLPQKTLDSLHENLNDIKWYSDCRELTKKVADPRDNIKGTIGGCWESYGGRSGVLHLDGGTGSLDQRGIYAHEIGHAIDWIKGEKIDEHRYRLGSPISGSQEWSAAYVEEILSGKLGQYAMSATYEGFAEFSRLVYSGQRLREIAEDFPKCFAVFKKHGLV